MREAAPARSSAKTQETAGGQTTKPDGLSYLTFFGVAKKSGVERALFCDEEQVYVAAAGELIGGKYRVVRIGVASAEIEDLARHTLETLAMAAS